MKKYFAIIVMGLIIVFSCQRIQEKDNRKKMLEKNNYSDSTSNSIMGKCYPYKLKWLVSDSNYIDTVIYLRNYIKSDSSFRIVCNDNIFDHELEELLWENKYLTGRRESYKKINFFNIFSYKEENDSTIIVHIYVSVKKSLKTLEEERLLIKNNKIIGINTLPCCTEEYIPYKEFINTTMP